MYRLYRLKINRPLGDLLLNIETLSNSLMIHEEYTQKKS